jgi:hypothetical protein
MAIQPKTISRLWTSNSAWLTQWTGLANGDSGAPLQMPDCSDRSIQIGGTFGAGGSLQIEGSNDGTNYIVLTDPQGNALTFTTARLEAVSEATAYIRPRVTAGDGTTLLTCHLVSKGQVL